MSWRPPTAKDALAAARQQLGRQRAPATEAPVENPLVPCGCGLANNADMMLDIRGLPAAQRAALGAGGTGDFCCPTCRHRAELTGALPRADLARALGAPSDHVARIASRERARRPHNTPP